MTQEQQRIAIAEACGWENFRKVPDELQPQILRIEGNSTITDYGGGFYEIPDYPNDLNAMHEAEKFIMDESSINYLDWLKRLSCPWHASAAQRAEAFLKTLNLWTQEPDNK